MKGERRGGGGAGGGGGGGEGQNVKRQREEEESGHEKGLDAFESLFNVQQRRSGAEIFHS